jgi:hypothetical protein
MPKTRIINPSVWVWVGMALGFGLEGTAPASSHHELPRTILALLETEDPSSVYSSRIHQHAEPLLNHLGFKVIYLPVNKPLPSPSELKDLKAVLTWFSDPHSIANPQLFCSWMSEVLTQSAIRYILMGELGFHQAEKSKPLLPACQTVLEKLGVKHQPAFTAQSHLIHLSMKDVAMVDFERKLSPIELVYDSFTQIAPDIRPYVTAARTDRPNLPPSVLVFSGPRGAMAFRSYELYVHPSHKRVQWKINPLRFLSSALSSPSVPVPDTTTLMNRRILYTLVEDDGIFNVSRSDGKTYDGKLILDRVISKHATVPFSLAVIAGYLDLQRFALPAFQKIYKTLWSSPNLELGTQGYVEPLLRQQEMFLLPTEGLPEFKSGRDYFCTPRQTPPQYRFNLAVETIKAAERIEAHARTLGIQDKKTQFYLWPGECFPFEPALEYLAQHTLPSFLTSDGRMDRVVPSLGHLDGLGRSFEAHQVTYTSHSNENIYTQDWTQNYFGYRDVLETFSHTEGPPRLKPIQLYFHLYSADHPESLHALEQVFDAVLGMPVFAIFASDYLRLVSDFHTLSIHKVSDTHFVIQNSGYLQTLRFDGNSLHLDMGDSQGVLGYNHLGASLMVFLTHDTQHRVILRSTRPTHPYFREASFWVKDLQVKGQEIRFQKKGMYRQVAMLGGVKPNSEFLVSTALQSWKTSSDASGNLSLAWPQPVLDKEFQPVEIRPLQVSSQNSDTRE